MKIIFESMEDRQDFMDRLCPHNLGVEDSVKICSVTSCEACWEGSGVDLVVKENKDENNI